MRIQDGVWALPWHSRTDHGSPGCSISKLVEECGGQHNECAALQEDIGGGGREPVRWEQLQQAYRAALGGGAGGWGVLRRGLVLAMKVDRATLAAQLVGSWRVYCKVLREGDRELPLRCLFPLALLSLAASRGAKMISAAPVHSPATRRRSRMGL